MKNFRFCSFCAERVLNNFLKVFFAKNGKIKLQNFKKIKKSSIFGQIIEDIY